MTNPDLPALRKLLADYRAFDASDTVGDNDGSPLAECQSWSLLADALLSNAESLIRAAEERDALLAACDALVCCAQEYGDDEDGREIVCDGTEFEEFVRAIRLAKEPR